MKAVTSEVARLPLRGGDLAVAFVNTVRDVRTGRGEHLPRPADLAVWAHHAGALSDPEYEAVMASTTAEPSQAANLYREARQLRAAVTRLLTGQGGEADLSLIDRHRRRAARSQALWTSAEGFKLEWTEAADLRLVEARVVGAFVALATSDRLRRVSQCSGQRCGWLYVDKSPSRRRRWCAMGDCGNRAKVRSFRARQRVRSR